MKKILNEPLAYVDEMLDGLCLAYSNYSKSASNFGRAIVRISGPTLEFSHAPLVEGDST